MKAPRKVCIHQLRPPREPFDDSGDCRKCLSDSKNCFCKRYIPVWMVVFDIEEK